MGHVFALVDTHVWQKLTVTFEVGHTSLTARLIAGKDIVDTVERFCAGALFPVLGNGVTMYRINYDRCKKWPDVFYVRPHVSFFDCDILQIYLSPGVKLMTLS